MKRKIVGITVVIMTLFLAFLVVEADKRGYITGGETEAMSEHNYLVISTLPAAEKTAVKVTEVPEMAIKPEPTAKPETKIKSKPTVKPKATPKPVSKLVSQDKRSSSAKKSDNEPEVKVLIMNNGFESLYHDKVIITCANDFSVTCGKKKTKYKGGRKLVYRMSKDNLKNKKVTVTSDKGARLRIMSVNRKDIHPMYRGSIDVKWSKDGYLVINKLPIEQYLYAVIPSEMTTSSPLEALKAQAVCARSFAYNQIKDGRYKELGADLDDSVSCQVYNNVPEDDKSREAVDMTRGRVMTQSGEVVLAYYFATSWGYTADGGDVWGNDIPYIKAKPQVSDNRLRKAQKSIGDLSDEDDFRSFISDSAITTYDSGEEWYRWSVTFNAKKLSSRIDSALYSCYLSNPDKVLTQRKNGFYVSKPLKSLGRIKKIRVEKRAESGLVTELVIIGKNNVVKVCNQYNIRKVLAPVYENVKGLNGSDVNSAYGLLPSAAFYVDDMTTENGIEFRFTGGGFGHGAGMSQTGAIAMAEQHNKYSQILKHYFEGVRIEKIV